MSGSRGEAAPKARMLFGVPRVVVVLGVVSLLNDLSGEMITPLLPLFLVALAAPVAVIGLVEGAADSATALLKVWIGFRSDTIRRRKRFIVAGYGLAAVAKPVLAASFFWPQALGARVLDRAGKGIRTAPRDAAITDATPKEILGRAFGVHGAFDTAGAIGGAVFALLLIVAFAGVGAVPVSTFQFVFLVASVPGAVSVAILIVALKEPKRTPPEPGAAAAPRPRFIASLKSLPSPVRRFLGVSGIFAFGNFTIGLFILRVSEVSGGVAPGLVAYIAFNIVSMAASVPAGILSDKVGRRPLVAAGIALFAVSCVAFALVNSFEVAIAAFLVYGVFRAVWDAASRSYLGEICPKHLRATALGAHGTVIGLLTLPGSVAAATLWTVFDAPAAAFLFGAAVALVALVAFFAVKPQAPTAASG